MKEEKTNYKVNSISFRWWGLLVWVRRVCTFNASSIHLISNVNRFVTFGHIWYSAMELYRSHQRGIFFHIFYSLFHLERVCLFYVVRLKIPFLTLHIEAEYKQMLRLCVQFFTLLIENTMTEELLLNRLQFLFMAHYFIVSTLKALILVIAYFWIERESVVDTLQL